MCLPRPVKPEMSGPLAEYILLHRHGAASASLAGQPAIALRLMVAHAMTGSALWQVRAHECTSRKEETRASLEGSKAAAEIEEKRARIASLFETLSVSAEARRNTDAYRLCEIFARLARHVGRGSHGGSGLHHGADTRSRRAGRLRPCCMSARQNLPAYWKPNAAFFDLLRDKRARSTRWSPKSHRNRWRTAALATPPRSRNRSSATGSWAMDASPILTGGPHGCRLPPARLVEGAGSPPADAMGANCGAVRGT